MNIFKKISLGLFSAVVFVCSAVVFAGCGDDKDTSKVYVFATEGGSVQVNDNTDYVRFGDEASKVFTFKEDETITLKAIPDEGYEFVKWEYTDELDEKLEELSTKSEISLVVDDDEIVIRAVFVENDNMHTITYSKNSYAYEIVPEEGYTTSVVEGGDFKFKVNLKEGYTDCVITVKQNNEEIVAVEGVYTIENITNDIAITISGITSVNTYAMTFEDLPEDGYSLSAVEGYDVNSVAHGADFKFKIQLDNGIVDAVVYIKGENEAEYTALGSVNGEYIISNVKQAYTIKAITTLDKFYVELPNNIANLTIAFVGGGDNIALVEYGQTVNFTIDANESIDTSNMVVKYHNGKEDVVIVPEDGKYTIANVTGHISVQVAGHKVKTFDVTLPQVNGLNIAFVYGCNATVQYNDSVSFEISADKADILELIVTYSDGTKDTTLELVDGKYTIENIVSNIVVSVSGQKYTVTLPEYEGLNINFSQGYSSSVEPNGEIIFEIVVEDSDKISIENATVLCNNQDVEIVKSEGKYEYTVSNITNSIEIIIEGLEEFCTITIEGEGFSLNPTQTKVKKGEEFEFTIELLEDYEINFSTYSVTEKNDKAEIEAHGQYNYKVVVNQDIIIVVTGIEQKQIVYTFNLNGDGEVINEEEIPYTISFNKSDLGNCEDDLAITTSYNNNIITTISELIEYINNEKLFDLSFQVKSIVLNDKTFVEVTDDGIIIDAEALKDNDGDTLVITIMGI